VAEGLDEISPPVPLRALVRRRHEVSRREEELAPGQHPHPDVEGKRQLVLTVGCLDRRDPPGEGPQGLEVVLLDAGVGVERHRRIKVSAIGPNAVVERVLEIGESPAVDPGLWVRGDVDRKNRAEWRMQRQPAGERLRLVAGMARHAVCGVR
jgi:hypothetical protein